MDLGTDLKTKVENPNRRSRHYTKQAVFEGSDRKIRGSIIRILLADGQMTRETMVKTLSEEPSRVNRILEDLEREGFIARSDGNFTIDSR
jgi:A/G-specific adenine glycosylase